MLLEVNLMNLALFLLSTAGMTNIIVDGAIFAPVREFLQPRLKPRLFELITCNMCCGFWCGILVGLVLMTYNPLKLICYGSAGSLAAHSVAMLFELMLAKSVIDLEPSDHAR